MVLKPVLPVMPLKHTSKELMWISACLENYKLFAPISSKPCTEHPDPLFSWTRAACSQAPTWYTWENDTQLRAYWFRIKGLLQNLHCSLAWRDVRSKGRHYVLTISLLFLFLFNSWNNTFLYLNITITLWESGVIISFRDT